jgi:hypothetical protein
MTRLNALAAAGPCGGAIPWPPATGAISATVASVATHHRAESSELTSSVRFEGLKHVG